MTDNRPAFGPLLIEGKTKQIYAYPGNDNLIYVVSKDQITAGDGARRNEISGKSRLSTITTANIFRLLNDAGIHTHFVERSNDTTLVAQRCQMIPIEHVQRRFATGSYLKRHPEVSEGTRFDPLLIETFLKDDVHHDPLITAQEIVQQGLANETELAWMVQEGQRVFQVLEQAWASLDIAMVDLKIEFGRTMQGQLLVADVIDNDSWRLWPGGDKTRMLDKQVYRNLSEVTPEALQSIADRYALVADLTGKFRVQA